MSSSTAPVRCKQRKKSVLVSTLSSSDTFQRLLGVATELGAVVSLVENLDCEADFVANRKEPKIRVKSTLTQIEQTIFLLHELGHASIFHEGLTETRYKGDLRSKLLSRRLSLLDEEFEAWHRAEHIAQKLGIELNARWRKCKHTHLMSYVDWVGKKYSG